MSDDLASRLRDIAEEYLYLDAPLKELKSKLLHEAADKYDDTCVEIARMNIEISNLKVELIKTKAVRNLPEKTKLAEQLTEARAEIERLKKALEYLKVAHKKLSRMPSDLQIIEDQLDKLKKSTALIDECEKALECLIDTYNKNTVCIPLRVLSEMEGMRGAIEHGGEILAKIAAWKKV